MSSGFRDVVIFEKACGNELATGGPAAPDLKTIQLRKRLVKEEYEELMEALTFAEYAVVFGMPIPDNVMADIADGSADLQWVAKGTDIAFGVDGPAVWREVARANHSKFAEGHWFDEGGKLRKSPNFVPPDIEGVLRNQRPLAEIYGDQEELAKQTAKTLSEHKLYGTERWEALYHGRTAEWMVRGYDGGGSYRTLDVADACNEARKLSVGKDGGANPNE